MIGKTIGNLKIVSELGEGGMGIVYLAEHVHLGKRFAVKSLSHELTRVPQFKDRFYREAKNQSLLSHPNIVQVTDFFDEHGQFFLVMEFVDGPSLGKLIEERNQSKGKLSKAETFAILKDVLAGLGFAHRKGVIHRDIKPANIMIDPDGRAKIVDFGISVLAGDKRRTTTGAIGSPWYMSPEQITRPKEIDHRSDIYSLGITLFEMLTGTVPFDGETEFVIQNQHINSPPPDPSELNPEISAACRRIILRALEKKPEDRFQSCEEFLAAILACEGHSTSVRPGQKSDIFISYKREEQAEARKLADALEQEGWRVWWDPKLRAGERFDDAIEAALQESKCVIVLWSKRSVRSHYVKDEAAYALNRGKLVPVAIEEVKLPFRFEGIHTPQLNLGGNFEDSSEYRKFLADIVAILGPAPHHSGVKAEPKPPVEKAEGGKNEAEAKRPAEKEEVRKPVSAPSTSRRQTIGGFIVGTIILGAVLVVFFTGDFSKPKHPVQEPPAISESAPPAVVPETTSEVGQSAQTPQQEPVLNAEQKKQNKIDQLLDQAEKSFKASPSRLIYPPGDNAFYYYQKIRELDPEHPSIKAGIKRIIRKYLDLTNENIEQDRLDKAEEYLKQAASVAPDNEEVQQTQARLVEIRKGKQTEEQAKQE